MNTDLRHLTLHQIKLILFTLSSMTFLPLASPALLLNFFIGAIIFNFQKLFYTLPLFFFFQYSLFCFFYDCNTFSHLSEDMNLIFQCSLLFPELTISFGENCSVFILVPFLLWPSFPPRSVSAGLFLRFVNKGLSWWMRCSVGFCWCVTMFDLSAFSQMRLMWAYSLWVRPASPRLDFSL